MSRIYLNKNWQFTEHYTEELLQPDFLPADAKAVQLPHTCKETPYDYFDEHSYQMNSGYKRKLFAPDEWKEKTVFLVIGAAAHESEVFVNGTRAGGHRCGYTAYRLDLSGLLRYGEENELVIRVDSRESLNVPPFGYVIDYMTYGGIYRDVYLDVRELTYLDDLFVYSDITFDGTLAKAIRCVTEVTLGGDTV